MKRYTFTLATLLASCSLAAPIVAGAQMQDQQPPPPQAEPAQADSMKVTVTDPGQGPHQRLRFKPTAGATQTMVLTTSMNQRMMMNGMPMDMQMPTTRMTMRFDVTDVSEEGDISYQFEYTDAAVEGGGNPMIVEPMREAMRQMVGVKGKAVVSDQGHTRTTEFEGMDALDPNARAALENMSSSAGQMSIPLPDEPVGVGGKWTATQNLDMQGIKMTQTSTFEVIRISGDELELKVTVEQDAPEQQIDTGMGGMATLKSMKSTGGGTTVFRLDRIAPARAETSVTTNLDIVADMGGQAMNMTQTAEVKSRMETRDGN